MDAITPVAQSISTYGLYAIIAILCVVVIFLYKRVNELEKDIRKILEDKAKESAEAMKVLMQNTEAFRTNTQAWTSFQDTLLELKTAIQLLTEKTR